MNWKKTLRYALLVFVLLNALTAWWMNRGRDQMYGALTDKVDHRQFKPDTGVVVIRGAAILSPDGEEFVTGSDILLEGGQITSIDSNRIYSQNTRIIDAKGRYLIPGLIDSHVHLFKSPNDLLLYVTNGVTQIREMIGEPAHLQWRREIQDGRIGPDMFIASPRLGTFGRLEGWFMAWSQGFMNIPNADAAPGIVQALSDQGYDAVKVYSHLSRECYDAVLKTTNSLGMKAVGHVPFDVELSDIWQSGQVEVAHFEELMNALRREFGHFEAEKAPTFLDYVEERSEVVARNLLENDIGVTSTLWLTESFVRQKFTLDEVLEEVALEYENPGISEGSAMVTRAIGWLPKVNRYRLSEGLTAEEIEGNRLFWNAYAEACRILARNLSAAGVKIMAGTDANLPPTVPGFSLHQELESLSAVGMTNAAVLRAATAVPADFLGVNAGRIAVGQKANLVLLEKNPLDDISHTQRIELVVLRGKVFDRALLDRILEAVLEANDAGRKVDISEYL